MYPWVGIQLFRRTRLVLETVILSWRHIPAVSGWEASELTFLMINNLIDNSRDACKEIGIFNLGCVPLCIRFVYHIVMIFPFHFVFYPKGLKELGDFFFGLSRLGGLLVAGNFSSLAS